MRRNDNRNLPIHTDDNIIYGEQSLHGTTSLTDGEATVLPKTFPLVFGNRMNEEKADL